MAQELFFPREFCLNLEQSLRYEWLETDGKGGYASSTLLNCPTRKYHGLLVLPLPGLPSKYVLLSKMEAVLKGEKMDFHLSTNKYPKVFYPTGHKYIEHISVKHFTTTQWKIGEVIIERSMMMLRDTSVLLMRYEVVKSPKPCTMHFLPLLAYRDYHHLSHENMHMQVKVFAESPGVYKIEPYQGMPPLYITTSEKSTFYPSPTWNRNIEFLEERDRGYPYQEDLFNPGILEKKLKSGEVVYIAASITPVEEKLDKLWKAEVKLREQEDKENKETNPALKILKPSARHYLVRNQRGHLSITAGYHWFGEWGRDTLISLPGLCLYTDREKDAWEILRAFAKHERGGLLPNMLGQADGHDAYNSIDAPLWYFWAVHHYLQKANGAKKQVQAELLPTLLSIVRHYMQGIPGLVSCQENGLIAQGSRHTQLTWMDAMVYGQPVTPRHGYAVEINALWLLALYTVNQLLADSTYTSKEEKKVFSDLYIKAKENFMPVFWIKEYSYLADVVGENGQELGVRPNQLVALTLPESPLNKAQMQKVLDRCKEELVTPYGLRTLSPRNPNYKAYCAGSQEERDSAYHQGTVWAWWVGFYTEAVIKVRGNTKIVRDEIAKTFEQLWKDHLDQNGLGGISEIFDGNPPHTARGCAYQAWSVAESIRALELIKEPLK